MDVEEMTTEEKLSLFDRWMGYLRYMLVVMGGCICIFIGLFGAEWFDFEVVRNTLSTPFGVGMGLCFCVFFWALTAYGRDEGWKHYYLAAIPIFSCGIIALSLGFRWESLSNVLIVCCGALLVFAPLLMKQRQPRPIEKVDILGRRLLYRNMGETLRKLIGSAPTRGVALAVSGPWGIGKSHFIDYVVNELQEPYAGNRADNQEMYTKRFYVASVDIWKSKDIQGMTEDIAMALTSAVVGYNVQLYNKWRTNIISILELLHFPVNSLADDVLRLVTTGAGGTCVEEQLISRLKRYGRAYVLVLDNVDRCDEEKRRALYPLLERLKRVPGVVTICGFAVEELVNADTEEEFVGTFQKLFDLVVPLAPINKKYLKPFIYHVLKKINEPGKTLVAWVKNDDLPFESPRQVEIVVRLLDYIDRCYLSRLAGGEEVDEFSGLLYTIPLKHTIFYWCILEMLFPVVSMSLRGEKQPWDIIHKFVQYHTGEAKGVGTINQTTRDELKKTVAAAIGWKTFRHLSKNELAKAILTKLDQSDAKNLKYAMLQEYLHLSALEDEDCERVLLEFKKKTEQPARVALKTALKGQYIDVEEPPIYDSVLQYAMRKGSDSLSIQYIQDCLSGDILPSEQENAEQPIYAKMYLKDEDFLLQIADKVMEIEPVSVESAAVWKDMLKRVSSSLPLTIFSAMLKNISLYLSDLYESSYDLQAPYLCSILRKIREEWNRVYADENDLALASERRAFRNVMHILFREYAYMFCRKFLNERINTIEGCLFTSRFDEEFPEWTVAIKEGVLQYLESEDGKKKSELGKSHLVRERLLTTMLDYSDKPEDGDEKFAIASYSYAIMWKELYSHYWKHCLYSLTEENKDYLKEVKRLLEKEEIRQQRRNSEPRNEADEEEYVEDKFGKMKGAKLLLVCVDEMLEAYKQNNEEEPYDEE